MDAYEATKVVLQRIQELDPENGSKIMGLLLIQDHGEKEMIRLALGPEALLHSVILKARKELGLQSKSPSTPSTPSPSPFSYSISFSRQNSTSSAASRFLGGLSLPSPLSIPNQSSNFRTREDLIIPSASAVSYSAVSSNNNLAVGSSSSTMNSSAAPFYASGDIDLIDEFELHDQLSFLNDGSPILGTRNSDMFYSQQDLASSPSGGSGEPILFPTYAGAAANWGGSVNGLHHRKSCSVSDVCLGSDEPNGGLGWKPCLYFARGYCKNGTSCRFLHGGLGEAGLMGADNASMVGSPSKFEMLEQYQELLRSKSSGLPQRLAAASQLMASTSFPNSSVVADKCMNFLLQQQQLQAESPRGSMMGGDMHKFNRFDRGNFGINGGPVMVNPGSRQIYLTFPADSSFKEEDVSNYFCIYGPVHDVRIPYQQNRMFGFVTFAYPETVKIILAKGNPHFVCDSRVLVKPYIEKGKVPDKLRKQQQQQHMEGGEFAGCGSPTGLESRDPYDLPQGARMFNNAQGMLWRMKVEEQADLQQDIELQNRRLMGFQLFDVKRNNHNRTLSTGPIISSPTHSPSFSNQNIAFPTDRSIPGKLEENVSSLVVANPAADSKQEVQLTVNVTDKEKGKDFITDKGVNGNGKESNVESDLPESLEHNLPDSPFASPKAAGEYITAFAYNAVEAKKVAVSATSSANSNLISSSFFPAATSLGKGPLQSCYNFQVPRFTPGQGTIRM